MLPKPFRARSVFETVPARLSGSPSLFWSGETAAFSCSGRAGDLRPALPITNRLHRCLCLRGFYGGGRKVEGMLPKPCGSRRFPTGPGALVRFAFLGLVPRAGFAPALAAFSTRCLCCWAT